MKPEQANDPEASRGGVLAALPRTRPQRTSARREAARARAQSETTSTAPARKQDEPKTGAKAKPKTRASAKAKRTPKTKPAAKPKATAAKKPVKRPSAKLRAPAKQDERAPKQGYEPEEELELGNTVHPPSGGELIESIADIFGELAGLGANAPGRLLKDALSIFRRP
ncbi:MAG TPA: hypothetical protein VHS55_06965 [Solirubrobacteraceae bacterium]|jgi:hypothetical protein|nr:hypothetical protein [Solirubrobacteraceae bacterium]